MCKILSYCKNKILKVKKAYYIIKKYKGRDLKNKKVSFISSNCMGGVIAHDLGIKFLSPTVNMFFEAEDYLKFVENLSYYVQCKMTEYIWEGTYPIGILDDIKLHFLHYENFETAKSKWETRCSRIRWDNIVCILTDQNGCTDKMVERFSYLPYKKLFFTSEKKYEKYNFCVYMNSEAYKKKHNGRTKVDDACVFDTESQRRVFESEIDILSFLNEE